MPNTTNREAKIKHRKRKNRITRQNQENIAKNAKKKTLEKLHKEGRLPKIAMGRLWAFFFFINIFMKNFKDFITEKMRKDPKQEEARLLSRLERIRSEIPTITPDESKILREYFVFLNCFEIGPKTRLPINLNCLLSIKIEFSRKALKPISIKLFDWKILVRKINAL